MLLPAGRGSILLTSPTGFDTDWGSAYRVAGLTTAETFADGELAGPVEMRLVFGGVELEGERLRIRCGVELRELRVEPLAGKG